MSGVKTLCAIAHYRAALFMCMVLYGPYKSMALHMASKEPYKNNFIASPNQIMRQEPRTTNQKT